MRPNGPGGSAFAKKAMAERQARERVPVCEHCHVGKAWGTLEAGGKILRLCAGCAGTWKRTSALPERAP